MKQRHSPAYRPPLCEPVPSRCPHVSGSPCYSHQSQTSREPQRTKAIPCRSRTSSQSCVRNHDTYSCANRYEQRALCAPTHVSTEHKPIPSFSARSQGQFSEPQGSAHCTSTIQDAVLSRPRFLVPWMLKASLSSFDKDQKHEELCEPLHIRKQIKCPCSKCREGGNQNEMNGQRV